MNPTSLVLRDGYSLAIPYALRRASNEEVFN